MRPALPPLLLLLLLSGWLYSWHVQDPTMGTRILASVWQRKTDTVRLQTTENGAAIVLKQQGNGSALCVFTAPLLLCEAAQDPALV